MTETTMDVPKVYTAITAVAAKLCEKGVGKSRKNEQQGYRFRGIDDFFNAVAPELATAGLCILPRCLSRDVVERATKSGGALFYTTVSMEFDFVCAADASRHTVGPFFGEAMDSGDKSTNKAMSAAYKYAVMQTFAIPVEGQAIDSEVDTHEVKFAGHTAGQANHDEFAALPPEAQDALRECAMEVIALCDEDRLADALAVVAGMCNTQEDKMALWSLLPSKTRAALKKASQKEAA